MTKRVNNISRRDFLKVSLLGITSLAFRPWTHAQRFLLDEPSPTQKLGRNCVGGKISLHSKPSADSQALKMFYEDTVVVWLRSVVGEAPGGRISKRWVETPDGYLYEPGLQPVYNRPNKPVLSMPTVGGEKGMWVEVTQPFAEIYQDKVACSSWLQEVTRARLYYSQVLWVDDVVTNSKGQVLYRVNERYGNCGDVYWVAAEAFHPITEEEIAPINPTAEEKKIVVELNHQTLSCYEGNNEVYFCRISSGAKFDAKGNAVDKWSTPIGSHLPWRKVISTHMSGGSTGNGWDTPGIAWTFLFDPDGAAIHSTFWHNDFGVPRSHGCVNTSPDDSKWVWRWTLPHVGLNPGLQDITGPGATIVNVIEA